MNRWSFDYYEVASVGATLSALDAGDLEAIKEEYVISRCLEQWIQNPVDRQRVHQIYRTLTGGPSAVTDLLQQTRQLHSRLLSAFHDRRLLLFRKKDALCGGARVNLDARDSETAGMTNGSDSLPPLRRPARTWIEIHLVDQYFRPVPNCRYVLKTPAGSILPGVLDDQGAARIEGIEPGACHVSFPDLDAEDWRPA